MKIAIVYNRESKDVINLFGMANQEKYGLKSIKRITDALKSAGHQAQSFEGDKNLIGKLEDFMPRVLKNERPGMVFNLSYGIQGQARYTHVPGILEMIGIPYVGSGPLAHSLSLDKVVAKMIFRQHGLSTPDFAVLDAPGFALPDLKYPLIVKPKNEAVSFGIKIVHNEKELRAAAGHIFEKFQQPVLVEQYIDGREINVGILGNQPAEALPPAELTFGEGGPKIYTYEDKTRKSGREVGIVCPAPISPELTLKAQELAKRAFSVLGCFDCARVDMRLDKNDNLYILEINSLPSLGEHGSYTQAAQTAGLDFTALVNRLVEVASSRYFGTPTPPQIGTRKLDPDKQFFSYLTERRDMIEKSLKHWVAISSRTSDPIGNGAAAERLHLRLTELGMKKNENFGDERSAILWESKKGLAGGTLLIGHLDVPLSLDTPTVGFRREPEWLYGEGVGCSRAPLVALEYALRSLRSARKLREIPLGVLYYFDEGRDCRYSAAAIKKACEQAAQVIVLRPGQEESIVTQRRGQRKYTLLADGRPKRIGGASQKPDALLWFGRRLEEISRLNNRKERLGITVTHVKTTTYPMHLPHAVNATLLVSYYDSAKADATERELRTILKSGDFNGRLELISDRPPMPDRKTSRAFYKLLEGSAKRWEIALNKTSSVWPTAAGYAPKSTPVLCGLGPVARELYTPQESVSRISLVQRTLLLADFLHELKTVKRAGKKK